MTVMTNDELERMMNFIIERQERTAAQQAANAEQLAQSETLINALIERQERVTEQQAVNTEQLAQSEMLINALAGRQLEMGELVNALAGRQLETDELLNALAGRQLETSEQLDDHDERIARFERSYTAISTLLQRHDTQLIALTDSLNNLITTVNRYITTRGNGEG
jgi:chromosome segregation ATPase